MRMLLKLSLSLEGPGNKRVKTGHKVLQVVWGEESGWLHTSRLEVRNQDKIHWSSTLSCYPRSEGVQTQGHGNCLFLRSELAIG